MERFSKGDRVRITSCPDPTYVGAVGTVEQSRARGMNAIVDLDKFPVRASLRQTQLKSLTTTEGQRS